MAVRKKRAAVNHESMGWLRGALRKKTGSSLPFKAVSVPMFMPMLITVLMTIFMAMSIAVLTPFHASASQSTGTLEVQLPQSASGIELTLYKVADYDGGNYVYTSVFADSGITIADLNDSSEAQEAAQQLASFAAELSMSGSVRNSVIVGTVTADDSGSVKYDELAAGLYLVAQTAGTDLLEVQPALIPVPYSGADSGQGWIYDVTISLKYSFSGGAVILTKTDDAGNVVEDAVFVLQQKVYVDNVSEVPSDAESGTDDAGVYYWKEFKKDLKTSESGQIVVTGLPMGEFRLMETENPEGYVKGYATVTFTISAAGTVTETDGLYTAASGTVVELTAVNTRTSVEVDKVDEAGNAVLGAKLVIKDADGNVIHKEDGTARYGIDTTSGSDILYGLPAGTYYLSEVTEPDGYKYTTDVQFTVSEEEGAENKVTMVDPEVPDSDADTSEGSLTLTKTLVLQNGSHLIAADAVYYVALFEDEDCTARVSGVKSLTYADTGSSSVTFEHLDLNKTYYIAETDEYGEVLVSGTTADGVVYAPEYSDGTSVKLTKNNNTAELAFENVFYELPQDYYYSGELTITKQTVRGLEAYDTDEIFYARVFYDSAYTDPASDVIELDMNGSSSFSYTIEVSAGDESGSTVTYYVTETDSSGTPVADSADLAYTMSVDKEAVTMSTDHLTDTVIITNTFEEEESEPESTTDESNGGSQSSGSTNNGGSGSSDDGDTSGTSSNSVQTGDETPLIVYLALLFAALAILLASGICVRERRRNYRK